jgi:hypothetical protein
MAEPWLLNELAADQLTVFNDRKDLPVMTLTLHLDSDDQRNQSIDPIPSDLRRRLNGNLEVLARRPEPRLLIVTRSISQQIKTSGEPASVSVPADSVRNLDRAFEQYPSLGPGVPELDAELISEVVRSEDSFKSCSAQQRHCIEAGLLLLWGHLDASHEIAQQYEGKGRPRTADYWHAIMHRREPDLGNSAYWFRQVGHHPAFDSLTANLMNWLAEQGASSEEQAIVSSGPLKDSNWNPSAMIELCRVGLKSPDSFAARAARRIQYLEILNLLSFDLPDQTQV